MVHAALLDDQRGGRCVALQATAGRPPRIACAVLTHWFRCSCFLVRPPHRGRRNRPPHSPSDDDDGKNIRQHAEKLKRYVHLEDTLQPATKLIRPREKQ